MSREKIRRLVAFGKGKNDRRNSIWARRFADFGDSVQNRPATNGNRTGRMFSAI